MKLKVLVVAHGHPDFSKGGAEIAAHTLFQELNRRYDCEAWLLAANGIAGLQHTGTPFSARPREREMLFAGGTDYFLFSANNLSHLTQDFAELLRHIQPDVVHFHHYAVVGIEMLRVVRNTLPNAVIVLTLHEFLAICNRNGQMLKSNGSLCRNAEADPAECHACMPGRSPQDYFLRRQYIRSFFALVDQFVAPSQFLKERYVTWGLPSDRISVIENGQPSQPMPHSSGTRASTAPAHRFAFFGQITPYKGLEVLLQAFSQLPKSDQKLARLDIFGGGQEMFDKEFQSRIEQGLASAHRNVQYRGRYAPEDFGRLVATVDWVIVPSIWWENSPLVIQEARLHGKPVICSDIGGMAEKVCHERDGLHFQVGSAAALADTVQRCLREPDLWARLQSGIEPPPTIARTADQLMASYAHDHNRAKPSVTQ